MYFVNLAKNFCVLKSAAGHVFLHKDDFGRLVFAGADDEQWTADEQLWPLERNSEIGFEAIYTPTQRNKWRAKHAHYLEAVK